VGTFEAFYQGPVQHPWLLWLAAAAALAVCLTRDGLQPSLRRYCIALVVLSLADAWLTANHVYGIGALEGAAASAVPLLFVLAGDLRYLLLLGAATPAGGFRPDARAWAGALGLTLVVPLVSQALLAALPGEPGARVLYLVYELLFFGLTLVLPARHPGHARAPWLRAVSRFVLLYYGLWAAADAVLLATGADVGFALRVVPNLLYYGGLIAVIARAGALAATVASCDQQGRHREDPP
jgi:hypothetical protein